MTTANKAAPARTILLASPRSFCAGVERAIEIVDDAVTSTTTQVYVRKQIVHNAHVVRQLERRGVIFVEELDEVPEGATVVFSAHGVSPAVREHAASRNLTVIDATCPLVAKVHAEARRFAARGDTVVLIGHAGHEEVEGTLGQAPHATILVEGAADVARLEIGNPAQVSYLTQTTLAVDATADVISALRQRFPLLREPQSGTEAHLIDGPEDIDPAWLAAAATIAVTAGASAPPALVEQVIATIAEHGPLTVTERAVATENVHFAVPGNTRP